MMRQYPRFLVRATVVALALMLGLAGTKTALAQSNHDAPTIIVPDFSSVDASPDVEQQKTSAADTRLLVVLAAEARQKLAHSKNYLLLNRGTADQSTPYSYMSCHACVVDWASKRGADFVLVGWILKRGDRSANLGMLLVNTKTREPVREGSLSVQGEGGRRWTEAVDYLMANRILAPNPGP